MKMKASNQRSHKPGMRKGFRIMFIILGIFLAGIIILTSALFLISPGKPEPFLDEDGKPLAGSISEKIFVNINGVEQGMFIKSKDVSNSVLLYIHGECRNTS